MYLPTGGAAYAYERRDSLALQLPGGATQVQQSTRTAFLTVSVVPAVTPAPAPAAYAVTIRLDSLRQDAGGTVPPDSLLLAQGTRWTGSLTPDGRLTGLAPDRTTGVGDQIGAGLIALFPALPPGGVVDDATWSDTTQRTLRADAFDAVERAVTTYHATKTGGNALAITSSTTFERTGERADSAQPMQMASHGARQGSYKFGAPGLVLDAAGVDSAEMTISIPAVGQSVPVSQRANWRFTLRQ
ncbi:MAG TPA: hypothetical protein VFW66_13930 [Gemmatimonadales bacterium]|nr:hypothetical protein [Gemmatimonadales bacterium]